VATGKSVLQRLQPRCVRWVDLVPETMTYKDSVWPSREPRARRTCTCNGKTKFKKKSTGRIVYATLPWPCQAINGFGERKYWRYPRLLPATSAVRAAHANHGRASKPRNSCGSFQFAAGQYRPLWV